MHLLKDMRRSPGGTLVSWCLVKGLVALREEADDKGRSFDYEEEYKVAETQKEKAIERSSSSD